MRVYSSLTVVLKIHLVTQVCFCRQSRVDWFCRGCIQLRQLILQYLLQFIQRERLDVKLVRTVFAEVADLATVVAGVRESDLPSEEVCICEDQVPWGWDTTVTQKTVSMFGYFELKVKL